MLELRKSLKLGKSAPFAPAAPAFRAGVRAFRAFNPRLLRNFAMILIHFSNPRRPPPPRYGRVTGP